MQTISYSKLSLFDKCPKAYEFKYIDKIQESFITIELHMGRCVHSVLEHAYTESINQRKTNLEELLSNYHSIWNSNELLQAKVVKKEKTKDSYFRDGEMMIRSYYSKVFINDRSQTISLEKKFEYELTENTKYIGVIDRISVNEAGLYRIIDYKTGRNTPDPKYDLQILSYAVHAFETYAIDTIELCYEDLRNEISMRCMINKPDCENVIKKLISKSNVIFNTTSFFTSSSVLCRWCGYHTICPDTHGSVPKSAVYDKSSYNDKMTCPRCGSRLKERKGKYGTFLGCTDYPRCRYTGDK